VYAADSQKKGAAAVFATRSLTCTRFARFHCAFGYRHHFTGRISSCECTERALSFDESANHSAMFSARKLARSGRAQFIPIAMPMAQARKSCRSAGGRLTARFEALASP